MHNNIEPSYLQPDITVLYRYDQYKASFEPVILNGDFISPFAFQDPVDTPEIVREVARTRRFYLITDVKRSELADGFTSRENIKTLVGVPIFALTSSGTEDLLGVALLGYRSRKALDKKQEVLIHRFVDELAERFSSQLAGDRLAIIDAELNSPDVLRVIIILPNPVSVEDYSDMAMQKIRAIDTLYSVLALILAAGPSESPETTVSDLVATLGEINANTLNRNLHLLLGEAGLRPLHLISSRYGSPASFDLLGLGKILEVIRDIVKDLVWRGSHEKEMAEFERDKERISIDKSILGLEELRLDNASKRIALKKERLENERLSLEILSRKLDLMEKAANLELSERDRSLVVETLIPRLALIAEDPRRLTMEDS